MWLKRQETKGSEHLHTDGDYTFLGQGAEMQGFATLEGVVRIDGHFNGSIHTNDTLIIGEQAVIRGLITADEIICSGKVEANLTAKKRIRLLTPAVLLGDITTPAFSMEDGAFFRGMCDMGVSRKVGWLTNQSQAREKVHGLIEHCELVPTH